MTDAIPLSVYVHIPWCVRKCPYCDFNSHALSGDVDQGAYVRTLLRDLDIQLATQPRSPALSLFIGGGTPSLFDGRAIAALIDGIDDRLGFVADAEITLEANPGTVEAHRFVDYRAAGVNRLSIGVQSLDDARLGVLGRIHSAAEARAAATLARRAGFDNLNLDLM
ncbi:MAG: radical SAM protein, partial [Gammaproteobacteria bacterium]|nr:radical SAM protein [Gammaproteobacteria bacterium]